MSASRVGITPSFAMFTVTSPIGFTDGAASRVDVSISPSLAMVRMTNSFGVIGAAASYVAIYTSPSFAMLAMVTKPLAEPEDGHSLDSDVFKSLSLLYCQLCCTPSCKAPNNEVTYESLPVDSTESAPVSQSGKQNIIATSRKRFSSRVTSVSASRVGINPSFAMFTVTSPYGFTDGTALRVDVSTSSSFRMTNQFGVIGVASSYVVMYTNPSFAMLAVMTKPHAEPEDDHSSDSDVSKSLNRLYSQFCCTLSRQTPGINPPAATSAVNFNQSAAHEHSDIIPPSLVVSVASCQSSYPSQYADGSFLSGASMDSYESLLSSESYDLHTSKGATALLYQSSANDEERNNTRLVVSPVTSLASCLSFNFLAGDYNSGGVSCDSIYSNGEPLGLDLEPLYYDRDDLQDDEDSDGASVFSLGDDSQYGQWRFTFVRPAQDIVQVSNNTQR